MTKQQTISPIEPINLISLIRLIGISYLEIMD